MTTTKQGIRFAEVEQIIAQRVANAIETIAIYGDKDPPWSCVRTDSNSRRKDSKGILRQQEVEIMTIREAVAKQPKQRT
ncbi:hypothetical protein Tco_0992609 [Tanacetum coccineum]|uniref:Uncharacterized protein n=1 Tax=Tanacetum coccineum TaxID=301880 RepID=A0ABQ5F3W9_9ASTR